MTAMDGAEGLRVYRAHAEAIYVVLTDMMMPVMNGPTMIGRLRELAPHLAVVGMTGLPERTGVKGLDTLELSSLLTKPFSVDELQRAMADAVRGPERGPVA
jgi:CheY-like chemotaxis protein